MSQAPALSKVWSSEVIPWFSEVRQMQVHKMLLVSHRVKINLRSLSPGPVVCACESVGGM